MTITLHPHAKDRLGGLRSDGEAEVSATVEFGEQFPAKFGRTGFRRNFPFDALWRGRRYASKRAEGDAVKEGEDLAQKGVIVKTLDTRD